MAIYCINAVINTALKFPLQVANIPASVLAQWDSQNRGIVREAGSLPSLPPELLHRKREQGGLGLERLETAVKIVQLAAYIEMLNREDLCGQVVRAGRRRCMKRGDSRGSMHARMEVECNNAGIGIRESLVKEETIEHRGWREAFTHITEQAVRDRYVAQSCPTSTEKAYLYGDGSTFKEEGRAGYGLVVRQGDQTGSGVRVTVRKSAERLLGKQGNDGAEARAILEGLLQTHPTQPAEYYCDNQGCVDKWDRMMHANMTDWGYRAIWMRIRQLQLTRESAGTPMGMHWVHSHVEKEERQISENSKYICACKRDRSVKCDPDHEHHIGNELADDEANDGAWKEGAEGLEGVAAGECWFVMYSNDNNDNSGSMAQGCYKQWLKERFDLLDSENACSNRSDTMRGIESSMEHSNKDSYKNITKYIHTRTSGNNRPSWRFWARMITHKLPTYHNMARYAQHAGSAYEAVYKDHIGEKGKCVRCGAEEETTMHAIIECKAAGNIWREMDRKLDQMWGEHKLDWSGMYNWILKPPKDWPCTEWGVWGMVPSGMLVSVTNAGIHRFKAQKLLNDTARVILNTANQAWELRNTQVLEWEREQPELMEQKLRAQRRQWRGVGGGPKLSNQNIITEIDSVREQAARKAQYEAMRARDRVTAALQAQNERKVEEGKVPTSQQWCRDRADKAAAKAHKKVTREARQMVSRIRMGEGSGDIRDHVVRMEGDGPVRVRGSTPTLFMPAMQQWQVGLWVPEMGTRVQTFWIRNEGEAEGGTRSEKLEGQLGSWWPGEVTGASWSPDNGELECEITGEDGHQEMVSIVLMGRTVRAETNNESKREKLRATDRLPAYIVPSIGLGSRLSIDWGKEEPRWCNGTVVAIKSDKGVAVRYGKGGGASVAWHTTSGLCSRGCRPLEIRRRDVEMSDHEANDNYQRLHTSMAQGCLLLGDQDEDGQSTCECHYCTRVRWPAEVETWRSKTGAPQHEAALLTDAGPVRGADRLKRLQSTKKKGAGRGQTETAKRGRADEGRGSPNKRRGLTGEDGGGEMELEGGTGEGAEVTAEKLATKEGNELTTEGGDGLTAGEGAEVTAPREGEDGVNADMVEGMIVAAQQWEQELLMFDNEVTQELEGADCTSSGVAQNSADQPGVTQEQLRSSGNHGPAEPYEGMQLAADEGLTADEEVELATGEGGLD